MADLNALLKDIKDNRLAWLSIRREKEEAFFAGLVEEIEALKAMMDVLSMTTVKVGEASEFDNLIGIDSKPKRGPGRPPKEAA